MTQHKFYIGSAGPHLYNDTYLMKANTENDTDFPLDGGSPPSGYAKTHALSTTGQVYIKSAPASDYEVVRKIDVVDALELASLMKPVSLKFLTYDPALAGGSWSFSGVGSGLSFFGGGTSNASLELDSTLQALAAYNTNGIICQTAADTFVGRTLTAGNGITVSNGNGVSGNPTVTANETYLNSNLSFLPLSGGTLTGHLTGTSISCTSLTTSANSYNNTVYCNILWVYEEGSDPLVVGGGLFYDETNTYLGLRASTGSVRLEHNGAYPKLETTSTGIDVTGSVTTDGLISSDDVTVNKDGGFIRGFCSATSNFRVELGTAWNNAFSMRYYESDDSLRFYHYYYDTAADYTHLLRMYRNGGVELYYDSAKKLETTSTGVTVTGNVISDGFVVGDQEWMACGESTDMFLGHYSSAGTNGFFTVYGTDFVFYHRNSGNSSWHKSIVSNYVNVELYSSNVIKLETNASGITVYGDVIPGTHDTYDIGSSGNKWDDIYATNGTIQTSDQNNKQDINNSELGLNFIAALRPVSYKWKDIEIPEQVIPAQEAVYDEKGKLFQEAIPEQVIPAKKIIHKRPHYGLIAQEVKQVLDDLGIDDFAGWICNENGQGLRYNEFIAPLIKAIQELNERLIVLEASR